MCSLQEHIERDIRAQQAAATDAAQDGPSKNEPAVESVRERPRHPVHIPEHLRSIVTEPAEETR
ncbi:hypothetical protein QEO76_gp45 [Arthrobacter phage Cole]|uniref:Uncharacterized protein n=1 Tax=Arthrobacter phage Cole TaxID=2944951 RepID=A0A9E7E5P7_9CAUD|nr:hypothetical protein QEO76_gp45 [Arthrobacter phage Cole]URC18092.1 hypothetical protein SEA_COLE_55 [Arthrobacter phage Cole]